MTGATTNENERVELDLDGDTLALVVSLCSRRNQTPGELLGEIIREEASKHGLKIEQAKSA